LSIVIPDLSSPPPFLLISSILHMVNPRNLNTNVENNDAENNSVANPPPMLEQVLVMQAQCSKPCSRTHRHRSHSRETSLENFRGPNHQPFHTLWNPWALMNGSRL
jgi:hypothetical protein